MVVTERRIMRINPGIGRYAFARGRMECPRGKRGLCIPQTVDPFFDWADWVYEFDLGARLGKCCCVRRSLRPLVPTETL